MSDEPGPALVIISLSKLFKDDAGNSLPSSWSDEIRLSAKHITQECQYSEQRFRHVLETLALVAIMVDPQGRVLFCNDAFLTLTNWQREAILGRNWCELFVPKDLRPTCQTLFAQAVNNKDFPPVYENEIVTRSGDRRLIAWHNTVQHNAANTVISVTSIGEDITDRKRAENHIYELSQRLSLATHSAQLGIWDFDVLTGLLVWDERMYEMYGHSQTSDPVNYESWLAQVHPNDRDLIEAESRAIAAGQNSLQGEFRIVCPNGEIRYIESHLLVIRTADGTAQRLIGINRNISDRKRNEINLKTASERLMLATEAAQIGIWEWTINDDRLVWDERMHDIWGVPKAAFKGTYQDCEGRVHPDDLPLYHAGREQALAAGKLFKFDFRIIRMDGAVRHVESCFNVMRDETGQPIRIIGINRDISDRKRAILALEQTHQQLKALMENAPAMIELYDETGRYQQVNPFATAFLNQQAADIEGRQFDEIHAPEIAALRQARIAQLVANAQPIVAEERVTKNGEERILQTVMFPVLSPPGQPKLLGLVATDITDIVTAQDHLKRQAEQERLLRTITDNIRRSLDLDTVLNSTVVGIREFLAADRALIYQFNADWSGSITVESVSSPWAAILGETLPDLRFIEQSVDRHRQGHMSQITNVESADISSYYRDLLQAYQVQANLVLPLMIEDQLWGLLCIHQCRAPRHWQPDEIAFVEQIADQVEIAIQQALLLYQTKIRAQREQVLNEIVSDIRNSLDLGEIITRTTQKLLTEFQVGRCVVIRCAAEDKYFEYQACAAAPGMEDLTGYRGPLQDNLYVLSILAQEAPRATTDVTNEAQLAPFQQLLQSLNISSLLSVAIRHEGVVKGILCVHHATPRAWTSAEQILIKQVADQLAIAIQQAELYQQAQIEISQRQRLENQLRHDALHDSLTGLPNRTLFLERLQLALQRYQRQLYAKTERSKGTPSTEFAVLFLDLDRFKVINDSLGHTVGDQLLQIVADRLTHCLRDIDIAARLGGDEFVILLEDLRDFQFAMVVARRIHKVLALPISLDDREVFIRTSIGITFSSSYHTTPEQIVQNADIAMYEAKQKGCEYVIFDASMHAIALEKMHLEYDLQHAIKRAEFRLYFQPIVALATGKIVGFEALVRWQHPTRGLLYPAAFIATAEDTGLIADIDLWVLNQACQQLSQWHHMGSKFAHLTVSVNLSGRQFSQPDLIQQIDQALASANLAGQYLKLEITESVLITNSTLAVKILNEFRLRDIQVCMDDFGTGYSSLSYLHQFPVDVLKIDKSFILNLNSQQVNSRDYEIVKAIIHLALNLHLQVIAEGIEHPDVWDYLQKNECQFGQGFHFAPALAASKATDLLRRSML